MATRPATPAPGYWTYEDLLDLPDDGKRYEIIEGDLFEITGPGLPHFTALRNLIELLIPLPRRAGFRWYPSPVDVFFNGANPVQPDFFALAPDSLAVVRKRGIEGPPDLVVEILSPTTRDRDELTKWRLYERAGVREYWLIDPDARSVEVLALEDEVYRTHCKASADQQVRSRLLPEFGVAASSLFAE